MTRYDADSGAVPVFGANGLRGLQQGTTVERITFDAALIRFGGAGVMTPLLLVLRTEKAPAMCSATFAALVLPPPLRDVLVRCCLERSQCPAGTTIYVDDCANAGAEIDLSGAFVAAYGDRDDVTFTVVAPTLRAQIPWPVFAPRAAAKTEET